MWSLVATTPAAAEPVKVIPDIQDHCRLTADEAAASRADIGSKIKAARQACELITRRQLITATWTLKLDTWREEGIMRFDSLYLPLPPLATVTTVKYIDGAGNQQTWSQDAAGYTVEAPSGADAARGRVYPSFGQTWPDLQARPAAVEIEYVAGYGDADAVPEQLREGIKRYTAELYERREEGVMGALTPALIRASSAWDDFRAY